MHAIQAPILFGSAEPTHPVDLIFPVATTVPAVALRTTFVPVEVEATTFVGENRLEDAVIAPVDMICVATTFPAKDHTEPPLHHVSQAFDLARYEEVASELRTLTSPTPPTFGCHIALAVDVPILAGVLDHGQGARQVEARA